MSDVSTGVPGYIAIMYPKVNLVGELFFEPDWVEYESGKVEKMPEATASGKTIQWVFLSRSGSGVYLLPSQIHPDLKPFDKLFQFKDAKASRVDVDDFFSLAFSIAMVAGPMKQFSIRCGSE